MSHTMLGRVLSVLDAVSAGPADRRTLAAATGLPQATCNRIVATLLAERLLTTDSDPSRLRLGLRLFELGTSAAVTLVDAATPYLLDLQRAFGGTAQLGVLDGDDVIYLLKIDPARPSPLPTRVAARFPPHCTGAGKLLLAFAPPERVDEILSRLALRPRTPATITTRSALLADLRGVRRRGYALDAEEFRTGVAGVAVPVRPAGARVPAAALTLSGPAATFDAVRAAHALHTVAALIAARVGAG